MRSVLFFLLNICIAVSAAAQQNSVALTYFGYAAIVCDFDDPLDDTDKVDYSDEVAGFTNANQVCVTADTKILARRLRQAARQFTPVFYIEPVFFSQDQTRLRVNPDAETLWELVRGAITASGVDPAELIFYIADEPTLRGLEPEAISNAAMQIRRDYSASRIMLIEAYHGPLAPVIPAEIDIWGFNAYAITDPMAEPLYTGYLDLAGNALLPHQSLALIMDANHTPYHVQAGISETDMAQVAENYLKLAKSRSDVSMVLAYTWAGGIDNLDEKGVRDLPEEVARAHRRIGREIIGAR